MKVFSMDEADVFHEIPRMDDSRLAEIFAREVLAFLVGKELLSPEWAEVIRKVYEVDPMVCPQCGGTMKIVAFLTEYAVVDRIIDYLKMTFVAAKPPPSHLFTEVALMAAEQSADYF